jgi:hypothetical protein
MSIHSIPGKLEVEWRDDVKAVVDKWTSYNVTPDEFREAVGDKGIGFAKDKGVKAWIVDSGEAKGAFSQTIQEIIDKEIFPEFAKIGVKYFVTIPSDKSAVTKMSISSYASKTGPHGLQLVEVKSLDDAVEWLKQNA